MSDDAARLSLNGADYDLPLLEGTFGDHFVDIGPLMKNNQYTFDPGYTATASCESKITYIDGAKGVLLYRGYPIEQLAEQSDFLEVCYLLLNSELPTAEQRSQFVAKINNHTMVHEQIYHFLRGFRRDAHPMAIMVGLVGALAAFYHDSLDHQ